MRSGITYSPEYDLYLPLLEQMHPFEGRKYSRAYQLLRQRFGDRLEQVVQVVQQPAGRDLLLEVHTGPYLDSLTSGAVLAQALEVPLLRLPPGALREARILRPMRFAVAGTVVAVERVLVSGGMQFQMGGGFHHAFAGKGEGFCVYADAAIAIRHARLLRLLAASDTVLVIDLDAHRGNGIENIFAGDPAVRFFDIYNFQIYPGFLDATEEEEPYLIPVKSHIADAAYLDLLRGKLSHFLAGNRAASLAIYNAGTDVLAGDTLGQMHMSEEGVLERDRFVIDSLAGLQIPTVVLPSGGYSSRSPALIAASAGDLLERCAPTFAG